MKIVIIEDEKLTAKDLAYTISTIDHEAEIVQILPSVEEAINYFKTNPKIDLIFSDIELGDGQSFQIFEALSIQTPIIFCTAYNEFALKAFETAGIDYILKPISEQAVRKALDKYRMLFQSNISKPESIDINAVLNAFTQTTKTENKFNLLIQKGDKITPVSSDEIAFFFIENTQVFAFTFDQEKKAVNYQLDDLENKLQPKFYRANRQFLINREAVKEASVYFNRKLLVHLRLKFEEQIIISKEKATSFLEWLSKF